jgi:serine protease
MRTFPGKWLIQCLSALLLGGCLHVQLFGPVRDADISVVELRNRSVVVYQTRSWNESDAREELGAGFWDSLTADLQLVWFGAAPADASVLDDDTLYLVTAFDGFDEDVNVDGVRDAVATPVFGQWHAIVTGRQLRGLYAKISPLTEAIYRSLELSLDNLSDEEIIAAMDVAAKNMVDDRNGDGNITYEDVLWWHRLVNADSYQRDIADVNALTEAIENGAAAGDIRLLSRTVIGQDAGSGSTYQVSGTISVAPFTSVDGDVNDFNAAFFDNSLESSPQPLQNPTVLGGYVNLPAEGAFGASVLTGDLEDYYLVDLLEDQQITLIMAEDPAVNDIDLYLFTAAGELIDASLGFSEVEQLTVPEAGLYLVNVSAFEGASNYRLSIGVGEVLSQERPLRLSDRFIVDEVIADFREDRAAVKTLAGRRAFTGMRVFGGLRRANLLQYGENRSQALARMGVRRPVRMKDSPDSVARRKLETVLAMKRLRQRSEVRNADLNYIVEAAALPDDDYYAEQRWHYEMLNLPQAWDVARGDGAIVAVIDSGVVMDHPDLQGQLLPGFDFIRSSSISADGDGIDPDPDDPGDSEGTSASSFHGTHVAGTVAAASNNARGVSGVAWNASIMPLRALGRGGGTTYDVMQSVRYAAGFSNDSGTVPARAADVINLSLGGGGFSSVEQALFDAVADAGIIVVAAAGNESTSDFSYPASYSNVVSVSAVNINRRLAYYSNFGSRVDIAAPGGDSLTGDVNGDGVPDLVLSTSADDSSLPLRPTYALLQGTSMATPHVAGVAALMKSIYPALTPADFNSLLAQGLLTDDLGVAGRDNSFGFGLVNAYKAVLAAEALSSGEDIADVPVVAVNTGTLNFGLVASVRSLEVSNGGTGLLEVLSVTASDPWLSVAAASVDPQGVGRYDVMADRSLLEPGTYSGQVVIESNAGQRVIQVILQELSDSASTGDAGLHYVLLINAETDEVEQEDVVSAVDGQYHYRFENVPAGQYEILAGGDADNDFFICDAGEACGAYPVFDQTPLQIVVGSDLYGLDFSTTFNTGIVASSAGSSKLGQRRPRPLSTR